MENSTFPFFLLPLTSICEGTRLPCSCWCCCKAEQGIAQFSYPEAAILHAQVINTQLLSCTHLPQCLHHFLLFVQLHCMTCSLAWWFLSFSPITPPVSLTHVLCCHQHKCLYLFYTRACCSPSLQLRAKKLWLIFFFFIFQQVQFKTKNNLVELMMRACDPSSREAEAG